MRQTIHKPRSFSVAAVMRVIVGVGVLVVAGIYLLNRPVTSNAIVEFPHIHGLGFSDDGTRLFAPAHIGLFVFENGNWLTPDVPAHDYMGFSATDNGFYSSGHPDLRTDFESLLGLVKSEDGGRTLNVLAFAGESDFHLMGVGYRSHAVYVINPSPNSQLSTGLFYTLDDGATWNQSQAIGLSANPIQIAVHPTEAGTVALATETGLHISNDYGNTFTLTGDTSPVSAAAFAPDGAMLLFGYQSLYTLNLSNGETTLIQVPSIAETDAVAYIGVNPMTNAIAFATINKDIYLSQANRQSWEQIAEQGMGRSG